MRLFVTVSVVAFAVLWTFGVQNWLAQSVQGSAERGPTSIARADAATAIALAPPIVEPTRSRVATTVTAAMLPPVIESTPTLTLTVVPTRTPEPTATTIDLAAPPARTGNERMPSFGAREIVIVDADSGAVLFEQAAHRRVAPASTTKIVTALVALRNRDWSEMVTADFDETELYDSTLMGLRRGERVSLEDLLFGLMLPSGNDAALAIASHVAGSPSRFATEMNERAAELGLLNSQFRNPHGLDATGHYSSAYDMVQFARAGMRDPRFRELSSARTRVVHPGGRSYEIVNLNRLLGQLSGADGVKIGYTEDAGRTIVASATRNGHRVYIGAFHSADLVGDCKPLFEWVFRNYTWKQ
ncbi:MAG: D-alanyl-D-alanine carboxypeptidase [Chloroflexota bacterium]|nr:MAG: D-alanyl-D-alanine carboxypeptidase [Chloroflexota bacterium]